MEVTPIFTRNRESTKKIIINRGGTRSSKTYSIAQLCALWLISGECGKRLEVNKEGELIKVSNYIRKGTWSTVRKYSTTLDKTVIRDFEEILNNNGWYDLVKHNKTKKEYRFQGRLVEFFGADDEQKLKGAKRNILYCNEGDELEFKKEFHQLLMRTEDKIFIDFNPDDEDIWINTEIEQKRVQTKGDVEVIVSNYLDNTFLPQGLIEEIEYLKPVYNDEGELISGDEQFWTVYGTGEYGKITGLIFPNVKVCKKIPENASLVAAGLDFGFSSSYTAVVDVYRQDMNLYFDEVLYELNLTNPDIATDLKQKGFERTKELICDSAEPKSIEELYRLNINAKPTRDKSVHHGIDILKRFTMHTTERSVNLRKEDRKYKWATDKNGKEIVDSKGKKVPLKVYDHGWDARRYVALTKLHEHRRGQYFIR